MYRLSEIVFLAILLIAGVSIGCGNIGQNLVDADSDMEPDVDPDSDEDIQSDSDITSDPDAESEPDGDRDGDGEVAPPASTTFLIHDQTFVIPGNAENNDVVGFLNQFWNIWNEVNTDYEIVSGNDENIFSINNYGKLVIDNASKLMSSGEYSLVIEATNTTNRETQRATITIEVLDISNVYFIDPSATNPGDGSRENPFNTWQQTEYGYDPENGHSYLQKRGTIDRIWGMEFENKSDILLGSYGSNDELPRIEASDTSFVLKFITSRDITVRDLDLYSPVDCDDIVQFNDMDYGNETVNNRIDNCRIHGSEDGITNQGYGISVIEVGAENFSVLNCEIFNIGDDAIFLKNTRDATIAYNYIHDINKYWWTDPDNPEEHSGGDCVQITTSTDPDVSTGIGRARVHHNILDHSSAGDKFCALFYSANETSVDIAEYTFNYCNHRNNVGLSLYNQLDSAIVRYNTFEGPEAGAIHASGEFELDITYNIFRNLSYGIDLPFTQSFTTTIHNNVFHNLSGRVFFSSELVISIKNNIFSEFHEFFVGEYDTITFDSDYNLFYPNIPSNISIGEHSIEADPMFVDADNGDFHLESGSPARNAGTDLGESTDIEGNDVPSGPSPDIGAFEYQD